MANNQAITTPISIRNIGQHGLITDTVIDESLMPTGAVSWAVNVHFDRIGAATVRTGITIIGSQIADTYSIKGLHQFLDTGAGTNDRLIAVANTVVYALVSGTWTSKRTGLTANSKTRFTNFVDYVFMVNGVDAMNTWDGGAGNFSTTHTTSAPAAAFIDNFRSRVWAARTVANPSRLYYSAIADASGNVIWTGDDSGFIDIAPGDGEDITGIKKFGTVLCVFKNSNIYRLFSINQTEPDPQISTGTYSQESITVAKDGMYWHHPSGIYKLSKGGAAPIEISRTIYDVIKNIARSFYSEVSSWNDDDHVYFSVGSVTINGISITNCVIRWTISTELWTIYDYAQRLLIGANYDTGSEIVRVVGDNDGNVYTFDSGTTDNGTTIKYQLETRWLNISGLRSETKSIVRMAVLHEELAGANVSWRNGTELEFKPIGQLEKQESVFNSLSVRGNRIKFSIRGSSTSGGVFQGFEILEWLNEGVLN